MSDTALIKHLMGPDREGIRLIAVSTLHGSATIGWGLLIVVTATTVAGWWSAERGTSPKPQASDKLPA